MMRGVVMIPVVAMLAALTVSPATAGGGAEDETACKGGDASACSALGLMYSKGDGVALDKAHAAALYRKACEGGDAFGCSGLGAMHLIGYGGVEQDKARAADLYRRACEGGDSGGCSGLGSMYFSGNGVALDKSRAADLYRKACELGHAFGCSRLGLMYSTGNGVAQDAARAADLYRRACEGGDAFSKRHTNDADFGPLVVGTSCWRLGEMYSNGDGVALDKAHAAALYRKACEGGEPNGCALIKGSPEAGAANKNAALPALAAPAKGHLKTGKDTVLFADTADLSVDIAGGLAGSSGGTQVPAGKVLDIIGTKTIESDDGASLLMVQVFADGKPAWVDPSTTVPQGDAPAEVLFNVEYVRQLAYEKACDVDAMISDGEAAERYLTKRKPTGKWKSDAALAGASDFWSAASMYRKTGDTDLAAKMTARGRKLLALLDGKGAGTDVSKGLNEGLEHEYTKQCDMEADEDEADASGEASSPATEPPENLAALEKSAAARSKKIVDACLGPNPNKLMVDVLACVGRSKDLKAMELLNEWIVNRGNVDTAGRMTEDCFESQVDDPEECARLCKGEKAEICTRAGERLLRGVKDKARAARGLFFLTTGCTEGDPTACTAVADKMLLSSPNAPAIKKSARSMYEKGCNDGVFLSGNKAVGDPAACVSLVAVSESDDWSDTVRLMKTACRLAQSKVRLIEKNDPEKIARVTGACKSLAEACKGGNDEACSAAK